MAGITFQLLDYAEKIDQFTWFHSNSLTPLKKSAKG